MGNRKKIYIILTFVVLGFGIGLLANIFGQNSMVYYPSSITYPDYILTINVLDNVYSEISFGRGYFPFMYVIVNIIKALFGISLNGFFVTFAISTCVLFCFCVIFLKDVKYKIPITICFLLCSYPLIFEFDRANVEYLVLAFLLMFFIAYKKEKYKLSAALLALPICMKLYPAVFVILFLKDKKYKEFTLCGILSVLLMVFSFIVIGGNINNLPIALQNFSFFTDIYAKYGHGIPYNHTIWSLAHFLNLQFGMMTVSEFSQNFIQIYTFAIIIIAALLVLYLVFIEKEKWKIITILTIMMITFPHVSFDYTLIHMYIPILYFITSKNTKKWEDIAFSILLAISIIPMNWFQKTQITNVVSDSGELITPFITLNSGLLIRPLILISIIVIIVVTTIKARKEIKGEAVNENKN